MNMQQLALQEAALKALSDIVGDQLKAVKAQMQEQLVTTGASRVEATLPDGKTKVATISRTTAAPAAVVTDDDLYRAWVRKHAPEGTVVTRLVTEVRPAYTKGLLAQMTAAGVPRWVDEETGELHEVPGVEIRATRTLTHSVRLVDGGGDILAEAWRSGALAHLDLPQITGGAA